MNNGHKPQKYTPKYWVAHDRTTDDVLIATASKNKHETFEKLIAHVGPFVYDADSNYEVILIEIREVVGL